MTLYKTSAFQFTHPGRGATTTQEVRPTPLRVSIHAPREGCDRRTLLNAGLPPSFNSRTPGGVRLSDAGGGEASDGVSIHAPREGCDTCRAFQPFCLSSFNSRTPGGVRQSFSAIFVPLVSFNSRTPGGVRLACSRGMLQRPFVSIHAPREGCDAPAVGATMVNEMVSIHAPREGCDRGRKACTRVYRMFQFTHPGRGATRSAVANELAFTSFNSRTPGGVRRDDFGDTLAVVYVSIHAPREGCDVLLDADRGALNEFQFTHPGRGATSPCGLGYPCRKVSIHAPREGCD